MIIATTETRPVARRKDPRTDATRKRICDAASGLFRTCGFVAPTMAEIAEAAGIRRSTLYTHFRDKNAILAAIGDLLMPDLLAVMAELAGPVPTEEAVLAWLRRLAAMIGDRVGAAEIIMETGHLDAPPVASLAIGQAMLGTLASEIRAFARAQDPEETFLRAWAHATLREFGYALTYYARDPDDALADERLRVAAMLFARFARLET